MVIEAETHPVNVLVAIDPSEKSWKAFRVAVDFAKSHTGATLLILHVVHRLPMPVTGDMAQSAYIVMEQEDGLVEAGKTLIHKAVAEAKEMGLSSTEGLLEIGSPVEVILSMAAKKKADVIILGNRGMGFRQGVLLGSVSNRVVANSPVTVIVVK